MQPRDQTLVAACKAKCITHCIISLTHNDFFKVIMFQISLFSLLVFNIEIILSSYGESGATSGYVQPLPRAIYPVVMGIEFTIPTRKTRGLPINYYIYSHNCQRFL